MPKSREDTYMVLKELMKDLKAAISDKQVHAAVMAKIRLYRNMSVIDVIDDGCHAGEIAAIKNAIEVDKKVLGL